MFECDSWKGKRTDRKYVPCVKTLANKHGLLRIFADSNTNLRADVGMTWAREGGGRGGGGMGEAPERPRNHQSILWGTRVQLWPRDQQLGRPCGIRISESRKRV